MTATIAVTTTSDRFPRWAAPLAERGFDPVSLPCIELRPAPGVEEARRKAEAADWLMITSPRVVEVLWSEAAMPPVPVAAVGPATARAVRAAGGTVRLTGDGDGNRLVELLSTRVRGLRVVIPHGARAATRRLQKLHAHGAQVVAEVVYDTVPVAPEPGTVDGAVFGSPSAVEGWSLSRSLDGLAPVGAIGRVTARDLRRRGVHEPVVASRPSPVDLAVAMSATLERSP